LETVSFLKNCFLSSCGADQDSGSNRSGRRIGKKKKNQEKKAIVRNATSTHVTQRIAFFCVTAVVIIIIRYVAV
jgi:hypothetical protein